MWDEVGDGAGSEGEGSCGPPFAPSVPVTCWGPAQGSLFTQPPPAVDKQVLELSSRVSRTFNFATEIGNLNFYMKSNF